MIMHKISCISLIGLTLALLLMSPVAFAQKASIVEYTMKPDAKTEKLVTTALDKKLKKAAEDFGYTPYLRYSTFDLNGDGQPEILAQFLGDYIYIDENGAQDTHIYAYTSKGLIELLQVKSTNVAIGPVDASGLKEIIVFKNHANTQYRVYKWDGKRRYVQK